MHALQSAGVRADRVGVSMGSSANGGTGPPWGACVTGSGHVPLGEAAVGRRLCPAVHPSPPSRRLARHTRLDRVPRGPEVHRTEGWGGIGGVNGTVPSAGLCVQGCTQPWSATARSYTAVRRGGTGREVEGRATAAAGLGL